MNHSTLQDDLAYVRDLAEAGQHAPLLGGRFLAFWGSLLTVAYFLHYAISVDMFGLTDAAFGWVWGAFILIGMAGQAFLGRTLRSKPGGNSVGNRVEGTVWMAAGFALFAYFGTLIVQSFVTGIAVAGFESSLPIVFAAYGIGLLTSGLMGGTKILTYAGYGAFGIVALATWFSGTVEIWAVASLGTLLTVLIPGLVMLRAEPKSVI